MSLLEIIGLCILSTWNAEASARQGVSLFQSPPAGLLIPQHAICTSLSSTLELTLGCRCRAAPNIWPHVFIKFIRGASHERWHDAKTTNEEKISNSEHHTYKSVFGTQRNRKMHYQQNRTRYRWANYWAHYKTTKEFYKDDCKFVCLKEKVKKRTRLLKNQWQRKRFDWFSVSKLDFNREKLFSGLSEIRIFLCQKKAINKQNIRSAWQY